MAFLLPCVPRSKRNGRLGVFYRRIPCLARIHGVYTLWPTMADYFRLYGGWSGTPVGAVALSRPSPGPPPGNVVVVVVVAAAASSRFRGKTVRGPVPGGLPVPVACLPVPLSPEQSETPDLDLQLPTACCLQFSAPIFCPNFFCSNFFSSFPPHQHIWNLVETDGNCVTPEKRV